MRSKTAYFGMFTALALIFSYVESLIPISFGIPGVKLGLANLVTVVILYRMGFREGFLLSVTRVVLAGFMFGNLFSIVYSLAGGLLSLCVMAFLKRTDKFSVIGVSVAGGVSHNIGQLLVAVVVLESLSIANYLPVLVFSGMVTGFVIGIVSSELMKRLVKIEWQR